MFVHRHRCDFNCDHLSSRTKLGFASERAKGWGQSGQNWVIWPSTVATCYWPGQVWNRSKGLSSLHYDPVLLLVLSPLMALLLTLLISISISTIIIMISSCVCLSITTIIIMISSSSSSNSHIIIAVISISTSGPQAPELG